MFVHVVFPNRAHLIAQKLSIKMEMARLFSDGMPLSDAEWGRRSEAGENLFLTHSAKS